MYSLTTDPSTTPTVAAKGRLRVAHGPKAVAPQELGQIGELRPQDPARAALEPLHDRTYHDRGHAVLGLYLYQQVNVVGLDRQFFQAPAVDLTRLAQELFQAGGDLAFEDALAVLGDEDELLGDEDEVVAQPVLGVCPAPILVGGLLRVLV